MSDTDTPKLTPANENPWYCLATLYGEQREDGFNREHVANNKTAWNRWMASALSDEQRQKMLGSGFQEIELTPFGEAESELIRKKVHARIGKPLVGLANILNEHVLDFSQLHFSKNVNFSGFIFPRDINFESSCFDGRVNFKSAYFLGRANFPSAIFTQEIDVSSTTFAGDVSYYEAKFLEDSAFSSKFFKKCWFSKTAFSRDVNFEGTVFFDDAGFWSCAFGGDAFFKGVAFFKEAEFLNSQFDGKASFVGAKFLRAVPDFRGAKMHEATELYDVKWPDPPSDTAKARDQVSAYERLKLEMERLKKHEDELFFFAKELRARQELPDSPFGARLLNYFYDLFSGYGLRMDRSLYWLLGLFLMGADVFLIVPLKDSKLVEAAKSLGALPTNGETMLTLSQAAGLSFANIFSILPLRKELVSEDVSLNLNWVASAVSGAQMIFGALLLFLLGLALRNRFRMK